MSPSSSSANEIMAVILSLCAGNAYKISALLEHDEVVPLIRAHGKTQVRSVIYSLATVGWLYCRGRTNSALYQTTAKGLDALKDLRGQLDVYIVNLPVQAPRHIRRLRTLGNPKSQVAG